MAKKFTSKVDPTETYSIGSTVDFLPGASILLVDDQPGAKPSLPQLKDFASDDIIRWGPQNNLPQWVIKQANKSPELLALIQFVVYFMYGSGLTYEVFDEHTGKGRPEYIEGYDQEIEDFIAANALSDYLLESIIDLVWFNHAFSECILNKKRSKIVQMVQQEAAYCRFSKPGAKGYSEMVYINANWPYASADDELTIPIDCINRRDLNLVNTVRNADYYKFMYPVAMPGPGNLIYQNTNWHSLFESGYYDVSILVPVLKRALMTYTMTIKYIIKVPQEFWVAHAKEKGKVWEDLKYEERKAIRKDIRDDMNKFLTGAENAGKSFISTFGWDKQNKCEIPGISIDALDDKMKDGVWIADAAEASSQFIRAHNLVPAIVGHLTGKGMGAGSGSDVRVHGNVQNKLMASRRDLILKPLQFTANYNGWTQRLKGFRWKIKEFQFDTLDVNHSTTNEVTSNAEPDQ
ncbi:hypothetical protein EOD41_10750 [Mucilaginibacter limnophilus]|uniref:Phage portal protein n=1 Tax=Mucilaginibacter limnophilus TaxID=1932778 RepID=A0A3S2WYH8_9SPHI|nr:hypothetical protein [Mucilaginibacter limnophilus]RVU01085.1 hypothetical protein EOD41_10750 [Mucilaginibacter limnophilus]